MFQPSQNQKQKQERQDVERTAEGRVSTDPMRETLVTDNSSKVSNELGINQAAGRRAAEVRTVVQARLGSDPEAARIADKAAQHLMHTATALGETRDKKKLPEAKKQNGRAAEIGEDLIQPKGLALGALGIGEEKQVAQESIAIKNQVSNRLSDRLRRLFGESQENIPQETIAYCMEPLSRYNFNSNKEPYRLELKVAPSDKVKAYFG